MDALRFSQVLNDLDSNTLELSIILERADISSREMKEAVATEVQTICRCVKSLRRSIGSFREKQILKG